MACYPNERERLQQVWSLVKPLNEDDAHHPHNEAFRAAVFQIRNICRPVFDPSAEDRAAQLSVENEQLKARINSLESKVERLMSRDEEKKP